MPMTKRSKLDCATCSSRLLGVLGSLEGAEIKDCDAHKTTNVYSKGQVIFSAGNASYGLHCIFSGRVKLYQTGMDGREQILRIAGPGDLLGYRTLFLKEPYSVTAEVIEDATICCIDKTTFFSLLGKNQGLALSIIKKLSKELQEAENLATSIAQRSVRERMAELLLLLKESYGKPAKRGIEINLHLSREELAHMIGITQETAIRLLSDFKKEGLIEVENRDIMITNVEKLIEAAHLDL